MPGAASIIFESKSIRIHMKEETHELWHSVWTKRHSTHTFMLYKYAAALHMLTQNIPAVFEANYPRMCVRGFHSSTIKWQHPYSLRPSFPFSYLHVLCGVCTGKNLPFNVFYSSDEILRTHFYIKYIYIYICIKF